MATPHIDAQPGDFASTVLMPGDPLRAKALAERFLEDAQQVTSVRNMLGFTGTFHGKPVSVMGSGMGIPSISIYAEELFTRFSVSNIVRIGSCGAIASDLEMRDLVVGMGACTDSGVNRARFGGYDFAAMADPELLLPMVATAEEAHQSVRVGNLFSMDLFYHPDPDIMAMARRMGVLAVEMEAAGLYGCAAACGKRALAVCAVSDILSSGVGLSSDDREKGFHHLMELALQASLQFPE